MSRHGSRVYRRSAGGGASAQPPGGVRSGLDGVQGVEGAGAQSGAAPGTQGTLTGTDGAQAAGASRKNPDSSARGHKNRNTSGDNVHDFQCKEESVEKARPASVKRAPHG